MTDREEIVREAGLDLIGHHGPKCEAQYLASGQCTCIVSVVFRRAIDRAVAEERATVDSFRAMISCEEVERECCGPVDPRGERDGQFILRSQCYSCQLEYQRAAREKAEARADALERECAELRVGRDDALSALKNNDSTMALAFLVATLLPDKDAALSPEAGGEEKP